MGQLVYQTKERQSQGMQKLIWNAEGLPAGIYFCVLKTNLPNPEASGRDTGSVSKTQK